MTRPPNRFVVLGPLLVLLQMVAVPALSQEDPGEGALSSWWLTAGVGASSEGFSGVAGLDAAVDHHLFSLRGAAAAAVLGPSYWDIGVLYGRIGRFERGMAAASVGLGIMGGNTGSCCLGSSPDAEVPERLSIPLSVRAAWHPTSVVGLGGYMFANINDERPFGGVALTVELGALR